MPTTVYIGLGSNRGDRKTACLRAIELLGKAGRVVKVSSFYCTEPVGYADQEEFINAVVQLETELSPLALLASCHVIEDQLGRSRAVRWGPRSIDLDILLYGDVALDSAELTIPHPLMTTRGFVLIPLSEIAPQAVHTISGRTAAQMLGDLHDTHRVTRCGSMAETS